MLLNQLLLFKALFKKEYLLYKRYLVNSIGGIISFYIIFILIFFGYKGIVTSNTPGFGNNVESLIIGYILWLYVIIVYNDSTETIYNEAKEGTLEQLYMSIYNFEWILALRVIVRSIIALTMITVMLLALMLTTGTYLKLKIFSIIPILLFTLMSVLGIGYILGGLALIFKKIGNYLPIVQFIFAGLIALPINKFSFIAFLPVSLGSHLINQIIIEGKKLIEIPVINVLILIAVGLFYFLIGIYIYKKCEKVAKSQGLLGHF